MFVGEGPGRDEDLKGEPFIGRAGQLLDRILAAISFDRTQVYIANIVKCRPPGNRDPQPDEMAECMPYLLRQIELINPTFICCLGRIAAQALLNTTTPLGKLRSSWHSFAGRKLMVTYHPAALLRFQQYKRSTWEDVQMLRAAYDELFTKS
jgi:DNA polymerase